MPPAPAPSSLPLARHARVSTTDIDEAADIYGRFATPVRILGATRPFSWQANQVQVGAVAVSASEFMGAVTSESLCGVGEYHLALPLADAAGEACAGRDTFPILRGRSGLLSSPGQTARVQFEPGFRSLGMSIEPAALAHALHTLTGEQPRAVRFGRTLALDAPEITRFRQLLRELVAHLEGAPSLLVTGHDTARLTEALLFQLLIGQPHSESGLLSAKVQPAEPRYVRRAAAYLDAQLAHPISLAELTRETGVSVRALQLGFQRHRGCTPLGFLLARRLQRARVLLLTDSTLTSVAQAARQSGFQHMSRFSAQYRQRFGETPANTLARRRGAGP